MRYILKKYNKRCNLSTNGMDCFLEFEVYFFKWKIGTKKVNVYLSQFVTWREFFNFWNKCIEDNSVFTKKAFERTFF